MIKKDKVKKPRIPKTENRDHQLLEEVNFLCPLCGTHLTDNKNNKIIKLYHIAHIYPHISTLKNPLSLERIKPLQDAESLENLIPLCLNCHKKYDTFTTSDKYWDLLNRKQTKSAQRQAKKELSIVIIEDEIKAILTALNDLNSAEIANLKMDPVYVKQKIEQRAFQTKILGHVTQYFNHLKNEFQNIDILKSGKF